MYVILRVNEGSQVARRSKKVGKKNDREKMHKCIIKKFIKLLFKTVSR